MSVLLPAQTAVEDGAATSIEITQLTDGKLTEDDGSLKTLCSEHGQDDVIIKKVVQFTEVDASIQPNTDSARQTTAGGSKASANSTGCHNCFGRRSVDDDNVDNSVVVGGSRHQGRSKAEEGSIDDADDIQSNDETTSIRTGVSRTPQVAAVIAMAGRRGRRRLGELFVRMSSSVNAERVARIASAARRLEQREIQATIRMAIIIAFFCGMWLGFFTVYVINSWCRVCSVPRALDAFFFWLGYSNSSINPILYTIFNDDFRRAFRKLLGCGGVEVGGRSGQLDRRTGGRETSMMRTGRL